MADRVRAWGLRQTVLVAQGCAVLAGDAAHQAGVLHNGVAAEVAKPALSSQLDGVVGVQAWGASARHEERGESCHR